MQKFISIIIPCYNSKKYLSDCLNSVINQTYPFWEALCINDGSSDGTGEILDCFALRDKRIKAFHQENGGVSVARNKALSLCKGDYVCFVDSDDMIAPDYLKKLLLTISPSADMAICGFSRILKDNIASGKTIEKMKPREFISRIICDKTFRPQICCMLFKTILIKKEGLIFWKGCTRGEDREFFMKYLVNASEINYLPESLYYYRVNDSSAMAFLNEKSLTSIEAAERTARFYQQAHHPMGEFVKKFFYYTIWKYMVLSILEKKQHIFSILEHKYDLDAVVQELQTYPHFYVRFSSMLYRVSKLSFKVFFSIVGYFYRKK